MSVTDFPVELPVPVPVPVQVPERSVRNDLRAVKIVWQRELIRFFRDKPRIVTALLQPMLYLFVFGTGMSSMVAGGRGDLKVFLFPGVMTMAVLFTSFFSAGSLVWDRTFQGVVVLAVAGLVGIRYTPSFVATVIGELVVVSFAITALGLALAVRIRAIQSFMALVQMLLMPLFFLSGALFPVAGLPGWLAVLTRLDPLTYAVDPLRRAVLAHAGGPLAATARGVTWFGWTVPVPLELAVVALSAVAALAIAVAQFGRD